MNELIKKAKVNKFKESVIEGSVYDVIAVEMPIALVYNGIAHVVMMATPKDLKEFALGFSLTEQIISSPKDIYNIDIIELSNGIEVHIELSSRRFSQLKEKRRNLTGRTGCGVCGSERIEQIYQTLSPVPYKNQLKLSDFHSAVDYLRQVQIVGGQTGCTHAAVWLDLKGQFIVGFEDIGRHVALDKLLGYRAKQVDQQGVILVSSRASYEIVQKAACCGVEFLAAVSAPTAMAVTMAEQSQLTLLGFFRGNKGTIYSGKERIK